MVYCTYSIYCTSHVPPPFAVPILEGSSAAAAAAYTVQYCMMCEMRMVLSTSSLCCVCVCLHIAAVCVLSSTISTAIVQLVFRFYEEVRKIGDATLYGKQQNRAVGENKNS